MLDDLPQLPLGCYRLGFGGTTGSRAFPGSAWRGAFGHALRRLACLTGAPECQGCPEAHRCAYAYVFDTPIPLAAAKMRRYTQAPHPFVLREIHTDNCVNLHLTLVGRSNAYLPLLVLALMQAAESPRGISGHRLRLDSIDQAVMPGDEAWTRIDGANGILTPRPPQSPAIPDLAAGDVQLTFETPLRVKRAGQHVRENDFHFSDLFGNLLRRVSMLSYFHTDTPFETDFRALTDAARLVASHTQLRWDDQPRHSARQNQDMNMGGVTGTLRGAAASLMACNANSSSRAPKASRSSAESSRPRADSGRSSDKLK